MKLFSIRKKSVLFVSILVLAISAVAPSEAVTRAVFLEKLLVARKLSWKSAARDYQEKVKTDSVEDAMTFVLRTGLVTDAISAANLKGQVTRREALRWCIQSLGLAFEAGIFSDKASVSSLAFKDIGKLSAFERGCLFVATRMEPALFAEATSFRGEQNLSDKEMTGLLQRVSRASEGLTFDAAFVPMKGMRLDIHRDGVPTGIPKWRVYADGFKDIAAAQSARVFFAANGFEMSELHPQYEPFLRTPVLENYADVRRLVPLIEQRKLSPRVIPWFSNIDMAILPHYWVILTIDSGVWDLTPIMSKDGPRAFVKLSEMAKSSGVSAAINAGFFATTAANRGYPIGALRVNGELLSKPYNGRSGLGWNENNEVMFGIINQMGDMLVGPESEYWDEMPWLIQAGPMLLKDGKTTGDSEGFATSLISGRHPRSVVGLTHEGDWFFLVIDGRNGFHATGATISELIHLLRTMDIPWALNLDGGGSSELIVNGKIYNFPSEGCERSLSYGLGTKSVK